MSPDGPQTEAPDRMHKTPVLPPAAPADLSDDALALSFADQNFDRLRFDHSVGKWFECRRTHWHRDVTQATIDQVRKHCRQASVDEKRPVAERLRKMITIKAVETLARTDERLAVTSDIWDQKSFLLGTPGGVVDLKTGLVRRAKPGDYISKLTSVAPADTSSCPLWMRFLADATKHDDDLIRFLQQMCGYALTADTREHCLFFIHGPGGNGKSVFLNTLASILGDYSVTAAMDTFVSSYGDRHPTDLAMLQGARLVSASETEEGRAWAETRIKALTGGDPIAARYMRQDFFEFTPMFKLVIVGNHQPDLHNVDDAARRRFRIVPFAHKPTRPDRELEVKLKGEGPGILRWMIDGCLDWQANGLALPSVVEAATQAYFDQQDIFAQWLEDYCCIEDGNNYLSETTGRLYKSWEGFAERSGEPAGSRKQFSGRMSRVGLHSDRYTFDGRSQHGYKGIELKSTREARVGLTDLD